MSENRPRKKEHISIQKFLTITSMMLTILLLFQSTQAIREYVNAHGENAFVVDDVLLPTAAEVWLPQEMVFSEELMGFVPRSTSEGSESAANPFLNNVRQICFIGDDQADQAQIVRQWCRLTKRQLLTASVFPSPSLLGEMEAVIVMGESVKGNEQIAAISELVNQGVEVVFCSLPDLELIRSSAALRLLTGIREIVEDSQELKALWQFDGFLLGGDAIYEPDPEREDDPFFNVPWLKLNAGTKTYMAGMLEISLRGEHLPPLMWRNNAGPAYVYVVNGAYLGDIVGLGILETFMYDAKDYSVYPVANAQMLSIIGFPTFSAENDQVMREIYGRSQNGLETEVLLPEMVALSERSNFVLTCFSAPQLDYNDAAEPDPEYLGFFLRQLRAEHVEVGLATHQVNSKLSLAQKLQLDSAFLSAAESNYHFNAVYTDPELIPEVAQNLTSAHTIVFPFKAGTQVLDFADNDTTVQTSIANVLTIQYLDVFRQRSIETLLGYSNATIDLTGILWPSTDDDDWSFFRERLTSNISTYWSGFKKLKRMSVSEGDERVRIFMKCEVNTEREGNLLSVHTNISDVWLILRTHGEKIDRMTGGSFVEIEQNVFLLHVPSQNAQITLKNTISYR